MSDNHEHADQPDAQPEPRRASPATIIDKLNQRLNEKASHVRRLEDAEVALSALVEDLTRENEALVARVRELEAAAEEVTPKGPAKKAPAKKAASAAAPQVPIQEKGTSD